MKTYIAYFDETGDDAIEDLTMICRNNGGGY